MKCKVLLFISLCVTIAIAFTPNLVAELQVYDDFEGSEIDQTLWDTELSNGLFTQSDGLLSVNAPPGAFYYGAIASRIAFPGDFEVILDWRDYPVFPENELFHFHMFRFAVGDLFLNSALIMRWDGGTPASWGQISSIFEGGVSSINDATVGSVSSGLFRITRVGSTVSLYYDIGGGWVQSASAEAFTGIVGFGISFHTDSAFSFHCSSDWISVDGDWISVDDQVTVPSVLGLTEAEAEIALNGSGLVKGVVTHDYSYTVPAGAVMDQNPIAGTLVDFHSAVDLVISDGPSGGGSCTPPDAELLHPLYAGLEYIYNRTDGEGSTNWTVEREFVEKMTANSEDYYQLRSWNYDNDGQYEIGGFVRSTQNAVYSYNPSGDDLQFQAAPVGTTWTFYEEHGSGLNYKVIEIVAIEEVTVPYGTFCAYKHRKYRHNGSGESSPYWYEWIVPGVGIIKEEDYWVGGEQVAPMIMELVGISIIGDFCGANFGPADGYVDVWDLMQFADHWHTSTGDIIWDVKFDLKGPNFGELDGYIDVWDLMTFADHWHEGKKP